MSAADKICALQNVRRFKLVSEDGWHGMTVRPDGGYVSHKDYAALADLADAQAQEIARQAQRVEQLEFALRRLSTDEAPDWVRSIAYSEIGDAP